MSNSLTAALVPQFTLDDCEAQELNCDNLPSSNFPSGDLEVIFPSFLNNTLPLSGGSIVKVDVESFKLEPDEDANTLILDNFSDLSDLALIDSLESLSAFRVALNREMFKLREFKVKSNGTKNNPPKLFLSYLQGDDSHLEDDSSSSTITRICKFKYVPFSAFQIGLNIVVPEESSDSDFGNVIGVAGKTFRNI